MRGPFYLGFPEHSMITTYTIFALHLDDLKGPQDVHRICKNHSILNHNCARQTCAQHSSPQMGPVPADAQCCLDRAHTQIKRSP